MYMKNSLDEVLEQMITSDFLNSEMGKDATDFKIVNFESYIEYNGYTTHEIIVGNFDTSNLYKSL